MKKHLLFLFILISVFVNAQTPESFYLISSLSTSHSIGYEFTSDAIYFSYYNSNYYSTVKTDHYGNVIWRKNDTGLLGGADEKSLYFIKEYSTFSILIKTDTSGNTIWAKSLGSSCPLSSGNSVVSGFVLNKNRLFISFNLFTGYLIMSSMLTLDTAGNVINSWCDNSNSYNPIIKEGFPSLTDGAWFVYKRHGSAEGKNLVPFDANGNPDTSLPSLNMGLTIDIEDVIPMADSTYLVISNHYPYGYSGSYSDIYIKILKFDKNGTAIWQKDLHDANWNISNDTAYIPVAAASDSANNIYIIGILKDATNDSYLLIKLDNSGNVLTEVKLQNPSASLGINNYCRLHCSNGKFFSFSTHNSMPSIVVFDTAFQTTCNSIPSPITLPWHNDTLYYTGTWPWTNSVTTLTAIDTLLNFSNGTVSSSNFCLALGVNEISEETFQVFPNPFSNQIEVRSSVFLEGEIILYDVMGKEMLHEKVRGDGIKLNTDKLPSGFYVLHYSNGKRSTNLKVIKQ